VVNQWSEIDLGRITVPAAISGTQAVTIRFEVLTNDYGVSVADTIDLDYAILGPIADVGGGAARRIPIVSSPAVFTARDEFNQTAGAATGKTLPVGGAWTAVAGGDATDFAVEAVGHTLERTAVSDTGTIPGTLQGRQITAGTGTASDVLVGVDLKTSALGVGSNFFGVILRWVDASNHLQAVWQPFNNGRVSMLKTVAGVQTVIADQLGLPVVASTFYSLVAYADYAGRWALFFDGQGETPTAPIFSGQDTALATGGALATGRVGIVDANPTAFAATRNFDNFRAWPLEADAVAFSGRSVAFSSRNEDACYRQDPTGGFIGTPSEYRGGRPTLPPGTSRIAVMARRNDITTRSSAGVTDGGKVLVAYRERRLVLPG
jgi:hypothetical protein